MDLKKIIADYRDFPKKGILFRDFNPILRDPSALSFIVEEFSKKINPKNVDIFVGIESRGFISACALAQKHNKGMVLVRKAGKLPGETVQIHYDLEYGKATLEVQKDAIRQGERVVICDDLLATGGTALATAKLVERLGGKVVALAFIIELSDLDGIKQLSKYETISLVQY